MKRQTKFGLVLAAAAVISVTVASLVCARGWVQNGADWYYVDSNNEYVTETIQSSGNAKFYLNENGVMVRDYFLEDYNENTYYFGSNGAMVTNTWVAVDSSLVENQDDYVPDNYWYYFQASGKAMKGTSDRVKKTTIDGKKYAFNEYGQMCIGWFGADGKTINPDDESNPFAVDGVLYYAGGDNDGVLRAGWLTYYDGYDGDEGARPNDYTNLYFYFNTNNNKKYGNTDDGAVYKTINGRKYAFNEEGVMYSGWDVMEALAGDGDGQISSIANRITYFSGQDDGHQVKKGWVYTVPAETINSDNYNDDEEKYMYFSASGDSVRDDFKKINGKFYAFSQQGIMKTGIVIWCPEGGANAITDTDTGDSHNYKFVGTIDTDWAEGAMLTKQGILQTDSYEFIFVDPTGKVLSTLDRDGAHSYVSLDDGQEIKLHLFGDDGARKTGSNNVEFSDDVYTINTNSGGDKGSGVYGKKYYTLGVLLKASSDIRYGIYTQATASNVSGAEFTGPFVDQSSGNNDKTNFYQNIVDGHYVVLTASGALQKGNNTAKKDADGNYWLINKNGNLLQGIWTHNVNNDKSISNFMTRTVRTAHGAYTNQQRASWSDITSNLLGVADAGTTGLEEIIWTAYVTPHNTYDEVYFKARTTYRGPAYQSDIRDGSNKWIPMGILDNSNKTITLNLTTVPATSAAFDYFVTPNDDYFVNCTWYKKLPQGGHQTILTDPTP